MRTHRLLLAAIAVLSLLAGALFVRERPLDEQAELAKLAPGEVFAPKSGSPPHYRSARGLAAFGSWDVTPGIRGYAGPLDVLVLLGPDARIRAVRLLRHRETKNYVHLMETPEYLSRFTGKSVHDRFEVDKDLDGISRATVSVEALGRTVRDSSRMVAASAYGIPVAQGAGAADAGYGWGAYGALFLAAFAGYAVSRRDRRFLRLRDATLAGGIVLIGVLLAAPFSVLHAANLMLLRIPSSPLWWMVVGSTLFSAAAAGRFYCGWLCPFGALSEFAGRLPLGRKWDIPADADRRWRRMKYVVLAAVIVAAFAFRRPDLVNFETYVTLFSRHGAAAAWGLVVLSLLASLRIERFWCRYCCPVAALLGLLSRRAAGYPSTAACPMANPPSPGMDECIRCNRCRPLGT